MSSARSTASTPEPASQPSVITSPLLASMPTTIRLAPNVATASLTRSGLRTAAVPSTTR